jgi:hypothetical protein
VQSRAAVPVHGDKARVDEKEGRQTGNGRRGGRANIIYSVLRTTTHIHIIL